MPAKPGRESSTGPLDGRSPGRQPIAAEGGEVSLVATSRSGAPASSAAARFATAVLFFTNVIGYVDRKILTLLVEPVKVSLGLSDGEIGLMQGIAFVITFSATGLLMGRLVDRSNRRNLLILCIAIWSVSAAAGGLAQTGWQLFVARMGVGVGEAALIPAAVSLFADYFPPERRGRPFGFFSMGVYAGSGLSMVLVGLSLAPVTSLSVHLQSLGFRIEPWRIIMFVTFLPGLLSCLLLAAMREPEREAAKRSQPSLDRSGMEEWMERWRFFVPHHLAMALLTLSLLGMSSWLPTVLIREYGMAARDAGLLYGTVYATAGVCSSFLGGLLVDVANRRGGLRGCLITALGASLLAAVGFAVLLMAASPLQVIVGSIIVFAPTSVALVIGIMVVSNVASSQSRGQITAIHFLVLGIVGTAGGPAVVGYANDLFGRHGASLGIVVAVTGLISTVLAVGLVGLALARSADALGRARGRAAAG